MNFGSSSSMRPESLPQGCCQLFEHLFLAGAALWDPHLTAGLYQKASPILLSIDVQHDVVFDSIKCNVRSLRSEQRAICSVGRTKHHFPSFPQAQLGSVSLWQPPTNQKVSARANAGFCVISCEVFHWPRSLTAWASPLQRLTACA